MKELLSFISAGILLSLFFSFPLLLSIWMYRSEYKKCEKEMRKAEEQFFKMLKGEK